MPSTLLAPNHRRYSVEPGVLDDRAALAFTNGHCHSLALALVKETGGELLGLVEHEEPFDHLLVASDDGRLIDIGGARTPAAVTAAGGHLLGVDPDALECLPARYGWVAPNPEAASAWVPELLARVAACKPDHRVGCFTHEFMLDAQRTIHVEWSEREGAVRLTAFGRVPDGLPTAWTRCMTAKIPENPSGERVIDFTAQAFERHACQFEAVIRHRREQVIANLCRPAVHESPLCPPA